MKRSFVYFVLHFDLNLSLVLPWAALAAYDAPFAFLRNE
jgi:hypothetical protein